MHSRIRSQVQVSRIIREEVGGGGVGEPMKYVIKWLDKHLEQPIMIKSISCIKDGASYYLHTSSSQICYIKRSQMLAALLYKKVPHHLHLHFLHNVTESMAFYF